MAISEGITKNAVTIKLNNGTSDGKVKTLSVNLGSLSKTNFDNQKAFNIAMLLNDCLSKPIYAIEKTVTSSLTED